MKFGCILHLMESKNRCRSVVLYVLSARKIFMSVTLYMGQQFTRFRKYSNVKKRCHVWRSTWQVSGGWKYPAVSIRILTTTLRWRDTTNFILTSMLIVASLKFCCQQQSGRHGWNWISLISEYLHNFSVRCWIRLLPQVGIF